MPLTPFQKQCYETLSRVPAGKVTTYRDLAHAMGTKAYRAVGSAMNKNPFAPQVPCHRVVKSDGTLGEYAFGQEKKKEILKNEGIQFTGKTIKGFEGVIYKF